jgi:acyl-CoA-dependent ceramide synthase
MVLRACERLSFIRRAVLTSAQWIYLNMPTSILHTEGLWVGYPHIPIPGPVKFFYLSQCAFYVHATLLLNAEAHRKDHLQMMTHHVITAVLLTCSYFYNFTRVGCMILVIMDFCDVWLAVSRTRCLPPLSCSRPR